MRRSCHYLWRERPSRKKVNFIDKWLRVWKIKIGFGVRRGRGSFKVWRSGGSRRTNDKQSGQVDGTSWQPSVLGPVPYSLGNRRERPRVPLRSMGYPWVICTRPTDVTTGSITHVPKIRHESLHSCLPFLPSPLFVEVWLQVYRNVSRTSSVLPKTKAVSIFPVVRTIDLLFIRFFLKSD